MNSQS